MRGSSRSLRRSASAAIVASAFLAACGEPVSDEYIVHDPSTLTEVTNGAGDHVVQIGLTDQAAARLEIETEPIRRNGEHLEIPLSAMFFDEDGGTWVYTVPEEFTYVREPIDVATEEGQRVFLDGGPPAGTSVVTVGVPELWGAETGMDH